MLDWQQFFVFVMMLAGLFLIPGYCATLLIFPREDLDFFERLPLGFAFGIGLFLIPFGLGTFLSWTWLRVQVLWVVLAAALPVAALVWSRVRANPQRPDPNQVKTNRTAWALILLSLLVLSAALTLIAPRDEDDWSYYQIVRSFADSARFSPIPLTALRSGLNVWWFFHAFAIHSLNLDIVHLGRDYIPFLMVPLSLLAYYGLAKSLFQKTGVAVGACALQLALYVLDLFYNVPDVQLTGGWVLGRIDQDHTAAQFIFLPVYAMLIVRYIRSGHLRWLGPGFVALLVLSAVHPQGFVQAGIVVAALLVPYLAIQHNPENWKRSGLLLAPYAAIFVILLPFISFWKDYAGASSAFDLGSLAQGQTVFPFTFRWLTFLSPTHFILVPDLLGQPALLGALLLVPWLVAKSRTDLAAQYLLGLTMGLALILYNPILFPFLSQWLGWAIYRLWYMFPSALVISYAISQLWPAFLNGLANFRRRMPDRQSWGALLSMAGVLLVISRFPLYVRSAPGDWAPGYQLPEGSYELLNAMREQALADGGPVLAPAGISDAIPAYHASLVPVLFRYNTPRERIVDVDDLYSDILLTTKDFAILDKYKVVYLVVAADHENISQFDLLPFYFAPLFRNDRWTLYKYSQPPVEDPLTSANTTFMYGDWQAAIDAYRAILGEQRSPAGPVPPNGQPVWRVFIPFAGLFYDSTRDPEVIQKQKTGQLSLAHTGLAMVLERSNLPRKAIAEYEEAVKLAPGNVQAHYHLAKLYQKLGMDREALVHAQAAALIFNAGQK